MTMSNVDLQDREADLEYDGMMISADSAYLVTASSDQTARLWDVAQGETIRHYTGHHKYTSQRHMSHVLHSLPPTRYTGH